MDWLDIARGQAGVITRPQLIKAGLSRRQIERLVSTSLDPVHPRVYLHRSLAAGRNQRMWAAALAAGGVVSHQSAAEIWSLDHPRSGRGEVVVTVSDLAHRRPMPGVRVYRVPLDRAEIAHPGGLPATRRDRTIVDLLRTEPAGAAMDLLDRSLRRGWLDQAALHRAVLTQPGRSGNAQLRALAAKIEPGAQAESERVLHRLLREAGIVGWTAQCRVTLPHRVVFLDVGFREPKVGVEVDGRRYHDKYSEQFEGDRVRQNQLVAAGWVILRFTWRRLVDDPAAVIGEIRAALR